MRAYRIVGAGFSGLTLAYYLKKENPEAEITVVEKDAFVGGLLQSEKTSYGVVEKAANALLDNEEIRVLAQDIGVELLEAAPGIKRAFILRKGRFKSWPLSLFETLSFIIRLVSTFISKPFIDARMSVQQWAQLHLGKIPTLYMVDPALGGIYAAPLDELNARLIFRRFFDPESKARSRNQKKKRKIFSIAPKGGMNELMQGLKHWLEKEGVKFELSKIEEYSEKNEHFTVFCGSLANAQEFFKSYLRFKEFFELRMLPVTSTTIFYDKPLGYKAFGVLYPRCEMRAFLGTLLNDQVFPSRYSRSSETWIRAKELGDRESLADIAKERTELFSRNDKPLKSVVTCWPQALPFYDDKLEIFLREVWPEMREELKCARIYVHGNYLGKLGLSQLLLSSKELAHELAGA